MMYKFAIELYNLPYQKQTSSEFHTGKNKDVND